VRFTFTAEQEDLRRTLRDWLSGRASLAVTRRLRESGTAFDRTVWRSMATDLGVQGVDAPAEFGGSGLTAIELASVMEMAGEHLYPGPLLPVTGLTLGLLLGAPSHEAAVTRLVGDICAGRVVIPVVGGQTNGHATESGVTASVDGASHRLEGACGFVPQADAAESFLVAAAMPDGGAGLLAVDAAPVTVTPLSVIDETRFVGRADFSGVRGELLVRDAGAAIGRAGLRYGVAIAAEALGAARSCLSESADHARTRVQFGAPIGSFQAVKQRLADALVEVELATSAVYLAACHVAAGDLASAVASVPMAQWAACDALARVARDSVQVHGGIGFTWEHNAHLFVKRAQMLRQIGGSPSEHLAQVYSHGQRLLATP
jgi:alkylation response protein AidB-like acyl-CoA dehydrogenase